MYSITKTKKSAKKKKKKMILDISASISRIMVINVIGWNIKSPFQPISNY